MRPQYRIWLTLVAYGLWLLAPGVPEHVRTSGSNAALTLPPALAAAACFRTARHQRRAGGTHVSFWLLGAGCLSWAIGEAVWGLLVLTIGPTEFLPSPSDPFYLALIPCVAAAVLCLPHRARDTVSRLRELCDGLIVAGSLVAIGWPLIVLPVLHGFDDRLSAALSVAYPAGDFTLLTLILPITLGAAPQWRGLMLRLTAALLALTTADVAYCVTDSFGIYSSTSAIPLAWAGAFCTVAVFARRADGSRATSALPLPLPATGRTRTALTLLRHVPVLVAAATTLVLLLDGSLNQVTGTALVVVLILSSVRQQLALWENTTLTAELESRVEQRTQQLAVLAYTDPLTGLGNRARFMDRMGAEATREPVLLLLDLDGFKGVNDSLGHAAGDELLVQVSNRLRAACRDADVLARIGGDEFAVLLTDCDAEGAVSIADRVLAELANPFRIGRAEARVSGSIGLSGGGGTGGQDLLRDADLAMYAAKAAGRNRWRRFDPAMGREAERRRALEEDLRIALVAGQLRLDYQPLVDLRSGRIVGAEALLRWHHPEHGLIPPDAFIPIAEETGLIVPIGDFVLEQACHQVAVWKAGLPPEADFGIGVNLSVHQLRPTFVERVAEVLDRSGLSPAALVLEVTESVFMHDDRTDPELLQALRRLGPKIFLDDFGTGYSSLSYLQRFPVDGLKIDRSFVAGLGPGGNDVIAAAVLRIAESLGLGVVAEGIENPGQRAALIELGCGLGQGYGMHRPMPAEAMTRLLARAPVVPVQERRGSEQRV